MRPPPPGSAPGLCMVLMLDIYIVYKIINYNKYKKTDDLDIVDKIKSCGLIPGKYNKTGEFDLVDILKSRGVLL